MHGVQEGKNKEPGAGTWNNVFAKQGTLVRIRKLGWVFPHAKEWGRTREKNPKEFVKEKVQRGG